MAHSDNVNAQDDAHISEFFGLWNPAVESDALTDQQRNNLADSAERMWRAVVRAPPSANSPAAVAAAASLPLGKAPCLTRNTPIEVGRTKLTEAERWKLQAAMRREAPGSKEYNKKLLRTTVITKGPVAGEAFPPGRGRPQR
jgi:hypothetical protein